MFANRISRLDELQGLVPQQVIEVLRDVLGQANGRLRHNGPIVLAAPSGGDFGDNELLVGSDLLMSGRGLGTVKWGRATSPSEVRTNPRTGKQAKWVEVQERDNLYGEYKAGNEEAGKCENWACSTSTGKKFDVLMEAPGGDGLVGSGMNIAAGDMIPFSYGRDAIGVGLGVGVGGNLGGNSAKQRSARATEGWTWVPGYTGIVGQVQAIQVDDIFGNGAETTVNTYYLPASAGQDPNVQRGWVFGWLEDEAGNRVANSSFLDAKIGRIVELKPGVDMPGGWIDYTPAAGYFPVGFGEDDPDYNTPGETGGGEPIVIPPHDAGEIGDHRPGETGEATPRFTIQTTALYTQRAFCNVRYTGPVQLETDSAVTTCSIPPHATSCGGNEGLPYVPPVVTCWVDSVGGYSDCPQDGDGVTGPADLECVEACTDCDEHTHTIAVGWGWGDFRHFPTSEPHSHSIAPHRHNMPLKPGHAHLVWPADHTHGVDDSGMTHTHTIPNLTHEGTLSHDVADFRPPWRVARYIIRVGPSEDQSYLDPLRPY